MGGREAPLTLRHVPAPDAEVMALLAQACRFDTTGGFVSPADYLRDFGGEVFVVEVDQQVRAAYLLSINGWPGGAEGVVAYAGATPGPDLTRHVLPMIEHQFQGVRAVRIETRRKGLIRRLAGLGYRVDGVILRKTLHHES